MSSTIQSFQYCPIYQTLSRVEWHIFCLSFFPCQVFSKLKWVNITILYVCYSSLFIKPISFLYIKYDGADFFTKRNKFVVWATTLIVLLSFGSWSKQQHLWYLGSGSNSNTLHLWWTVQYTHTWICFWVSRSQNKILCTTTHSTFSILMDYL